MPGSGGSAGQVADIEVLVGMLGGADINGESGTLIKNQLNTLFSSINKTGMAVKIVADTSSLKQSIEKELEKLGKLNLKIKGDLGGDAKNTGSAARPRGTGGSKKKEMEEDIALLYKMAGLQREIAYQKERQIKIGKRGEEFAEINRQIKYATTSMRKYGHEYLKAFGEKSGLSNMRELSEYVHDNYADMEEVEKRYRRVQSHSQDVFNTEKMRLRSKIKDVQAEKDALLKMPVVNNNEFQKYLHGLTKYIAESKMVLKQSKWSPTLGKLKIDALKAQTRAYDELTAARNAYNRSDQSTQELTKLSKIQSQINQKHLKMMGLDKSSSEFTAISGDVAELEKKFNTMGDRFINTYGKKMDLHGLKDLRALLQQNYSIVTKTSEAMKYSEGKAEDVFTSSRTALENQLKAAKSEREKLSSSPTINNQAMRDYQKQLDMFIASSDAMLKKTTWVPDKAAELTRALQDQTEAYRNVTLAKNEYLKSDESKKSLNRMAGIAAEIKGLEDKRAAFREGSKEYIQYTKEIKDLQTSLATSQKSFLSTYGQTYNLSNVKELNKYLKENYAVVRKAERHVAIRKTTRESEFNAKKKELEGMLTEAQKSQASMTKGSTIESKEANEYIRQLEGFVQRTKSTLSKTNWNKFNPLGGVEKLQERIAEYKELEKAQKSYSKTISEEGLLDRIKKLTDRRNVIKGQLIGLDKGSIEAEEYGKQLTNVTDKIHSLKDAFIQLHGAQLTKKTYGAVDDLIAQRYDNATVSLDKYMGKIAASKSAFATAQSSLTKYTNQATVWQDKIDKVRIAHNSGDHKIVNEDEQRAFDRFSVAVDKYIAKNNELQNAKWEKHSSGGVVAGINDQIKAYQDVVKVRNEYLAAVKNTQDLQKFAVKIGNFHDQMVRVGAAPQEFTDKLKNLFDVAASGKYKGSLSDLALEFAKLRTEAIKGGYGVETLGDKIKRMFVTKLGYGIMATLAMYVRRAVHMIYTSVVEVDDQMTELKKVTNETAREYERFFIGATERAKELGATLSDVIRATADFARLGYTMTEATHMADVAIIYKNVGDGIESIDEASQSIISTSKAFANEIKDPMDIVDKFNEVGNNFPVTSKGIGDALLRSASALASANNGLDESIALITAANAVVQDPDKVGTSLKTISMFLRAAKNEAADAGVSTEGMAQSVSKLREELLALTGGKVDIMLDEKTFKSTYQIMKELAGVWGQLSDITQANIIEKIGGKRQANIVSSLLQNFSMAEEVLATSADSAGSALAENEKYLDSITGRLGILKATYQEFANHVLDSDLVKAVISGMTKVFDLLNAFDGKLAGTIVKVALFAGVLKVLHTLITKISIARLTILKINAMNGVLDAGEKLIDLLFSVHGKIIAIVAALGLIGFATYKAYRKTHPTLEQLKDDYASIESDINELDSALKKNEARIEILQKLKAAGTASLIDEAELKGLKEENSLLEKQIEDQKLLLKNKEDLIGAQTKIKVDEFLTPMDDDNITGIGETSYVYANYDGTVNELNAKIFAYEDARKRYNAALAAGDEANTIRFKELMTEAQAGIVDFQEQIIGWRKDLSPDDLESKKQLDMLLDRIDILFNGTDAIREIWTDLWSDKSPIKNVSNINNLLREAVTAWNSGDKEPLEKLTQGSVFKETFEEICNYLKTLGIDVSELENADLNELAKMFGNIGTEAQKATEPVGNLVDRLKSLSARTEIMNDAKKDIKEYGVLTAETLDNIIQKYPDLESAINKYIAGIIDEKEMMGELSKAYKKDEELFANTIFQKAFLSEEFMQKIPENQRGLIESLASSYKIDLENFTTVEKEKVKIQAQIINELAKQYAQYSGASLELLKTEEKKLKATLSKPYKEGDDGIARAEAGRRLSAIHDTIASIEAVMDLKFEVDFSKFTPPKKTSSNKSKTEDKYKKKVDEEIAKIKHQFEMELITKEEYLKKLKALEDKYYLNSAANREKYAKEIRSIDEELFKGRREIFDDWVNDQTKMAERAAKTGEHVYYKTSSASVNAMRLALDNQNKMNETLRKYQSNVNLNNRKIIPGSKLKGNNMFEGFDGDYATLFSSTYLSTDFGGSGTEAILVTPILPNGEVFKSREEFEAYIESLMKANGSGFDVSKDTKGIIMGIIDEGSIDASLAKTEELAIAAHEANAAVDQIYLGEDFQNFLKEMKNLGQNVDAMSMEELTNMFVNIGNSASKAIFPIREIYKEIYAKTLDMIAQAKAYGLDESSDYVQQLRDQADKVVSDLLNLIKSTFDDFKNYADSFDMWSHLDFTEVEYLEAELKEIEEMYKSGMLAWKDYVREYNEIAKQIYDKQKSSIETIIDMTMEMIQQEAEDKKKALEDQVDSYKKIIDLKKKMLQETDNEQDYEKKVAKIVDEIAKLQSKIAQLSLDDSREALADRIALEEQLAEKQGELNDLQQDHVLEGTMDTLDKSGEAFEKEKKDEIDAVEKSVDTWAKKYKQAIDRIDNDWDNLYVDLQDWMDEHRSSIDGPDSLKTSWENVIALKEKYKDLGGIEDIYNGMGNGMGINPNAPKGEQAQQILDQMKQNSLTALRNPGSAGSGLNAANKKLADQYYQLTGQRLHQGSDFVWRYDGANGSPVYDLSGPVAEQNPYSPGRARFGETDSDAVRWAQYQLRGANYSQPVDGNFWQTTKKNILAFQKKMRIKQTGEVDAETIKRLKAYHSGGIVDGTGAINDHEVVAVLERGEWVLDKKKQSAVKSLISNMFGFIDSVTSSNLASKINPLKNTVVGHGDTFAPHVEVNITHNGKMTDADARKYGKMAGDVALEELRTAFKKRGL